MKLPRFRSVARSNASAAAWRVSPTRVRRISILAALVVIASVSLAGIVVVTRGAHAATSTTDPYTWGSDASGSLGNGNAFGGSSATPYHITSIGTSLTSVVSGSNASHVLAVGADGSLYGWGDNSSQEITSDTTTSNYWAPVQVTSISGVTAAATGNGFTLVLKSDGTVWAWGANGNGQLGIGTTANTATPTKVSLSLPTGVTIKALSAGGFHSLALDSNGNIWAWGYNVFGQLGNGSTTQSSTPVEVMTGTTFTAVAAGQYFSLALSANGTVYAWGSNSSGQLGNGSSGGTASTPTAIAGLSGVSSISVGQSFAVAATSSGAVYAWGDNSEGEIGNGSTSGSSVLIPSLVTGLSGVTVTGVAAGDLHALALASNGNVYAWGFDNNFQIGANAGSLTCDIFGNICTPTAVVVPGVTGAGAVSAGIQFSLALVPTAPVATLSKTSLGFGNQAQGIQSGAQTITVANTGAGTLSFNANAVSMSGANAADYTLTDGCSSQTVAPGSSCILSVTFKPAALGVSSATMTINDNASNSPQTVALTGNGIYSRTSVQTSTGGTSFKAGSRVSLQFSLTGASAGIKTATANAFDALVTNGTPGTYSATTGSPPNSGNSFSFTKQSANYTYTWNTKGLSAGTYSVQVALNDGTTDTFTITLT